MHNIKVLGTGCANCRATVALHRGGGQEKGRGDHPRKVESLPEIMRHGVMSTPGVVIDGRVVHAGGVPARSKVEGWL
ncbi:MAG: thioredoxin family protein [Candidatus Accumulibacter sp.]|nr:thioredoxin family protein [Accumulibacter sp.]